MAQKKLFSLLAAGFILPLGTIPLHAKTDNNVSAGTPQKTAADTVEKSMEYSVPCLTVWSDGTHGKISHLPLKFTRTKEDKPLRIMIADDSPNGSGNTIRSSIWLAAVTAAMLRNDTMHGTTISVEFSGHVDGPSAGGVTCLAILSAIDGVPLPDDFAMTGTILPDGTIGVVGGVPEKMRAAAKAGKKRIFIPAFLRFEKNKKGENIDLQRLADELNVKLHRVENISEAYAVLHNKKYSGNEYVNVREMTRLPQKTEDALTAIYKKYLDKVKAEVKADPQLEKSFLLDEFTLSPQKAETLYQEGKLYPAALRIFQSWQTWQAWKKTDLFFAEFYKKYNPDWNKIKYLREYHYRKLFFTMRKEAEKYVQATIDSYKKAEQQSMKKYYGGREYSGYFPFKTGQGEFSAQIEPVERIATLRGCLANWTASKAKDDLINTADEKTLINFWMTDVFILRLCQLTLLPRDEQVELFSGLAGTLPDLKANKRAAEIERLFYSAAFAADSAAGNNFNLRMAQAEKKEVENEIRNNPYLHILDEMKNHAFYCHDMLTQEAEKKASFPAYHLQASLKMQVTTFTMASLLMTIYGADNSTDFIKHMLRNARSAAVRNINECVKADIPCIAAICDFETAESSDTANDTFTALMSYWRASLYAKALLMSFK